MVSARSGAGAGEPASDWEIASSSLAKRPTRWGSLTWVSARPLIASLNHVLSLGARGLVTRLRQGWTPDGDKLVDLSAGAETTFILIGDTGEQDASQYVVAPALSRATRDHHPDFVLIMSDVIYPSGDVNDYPDGVYRPYRSHDEHFRVDAPILGLPGNHDWYDGLNGFMYHFVRRDQPHQAAYAPDAAYAPLAGDRSPVSRLCRVLWRRASIPDARTEAERARSPLTRALAQPGPYYAIQTPDLLVVCIDTGIDGTIDEQQGAWLREVSQRPGAKILATGKPLVVDEEIHPCAITDTPEAGAEPAPGDTVWEIVNTPEYGYLATVGGDVHNFQQYRGVPGPGGPQAHLVSGSGGAFMHATHTLAIAPNDSRMRARPGRQYYGPPKQTFPTRGESLALFASLLVPTVRRVIGYLMVLLAGAAAGLLPTLAGSRSGQPTGLPTGLAAGLPVGLGAALLAVALVVSAALPAGAAPRTSRVARARTVVIMAAIGLLITGVAGLLAGILAPLVVGFVAAVAALHAVIGWLLRLSGWWRPADESARTQSPLAFAAGLAGLAALVAAAQLLLGWSTAPTVAVGSAVVSALLIVGVGAYGQVRRRRRLTDRGDDGTWVDRRPVLRRGSDEDRDLMAKGGARNRSWHHSGLPLAQAVQAVCLLLAAAQLVVVTGVAPSPQEAVLVLRVVVGLPCLALVLVLVVAGVLLGATAGAARGRGHGQDSGTAWGAAARWAHGLLVPVLVAGLALLLAVITALGPSLPGGLSPALRAAIAPLTCVVVLVVALLLVDAARRRHPAGYLWFVVLGAALLALLGSALFAWSATRWIVTSTAGAAAVLVALGVIALLGHLSFLGAFWVIVDRGATTFTEAELDELFRARAAYPPRTPRVPARVLRWARLTSPALGEPGGILQREVSEIFSSDKPPFYKGFLRLTTRRVGHRQAELSIVLHRVYGDRPAQQEEIAVIPFATGDVTLGQQVD